MTIRLADVLWDGDKSKRRDDRILFSETPGRFIVTVAPKNKMLFEKLFSALGAKHVGEVTKENDPLAIIGSQGEEKVRLSVSSMKHAYKKRFGDEI
jgi:phosphoribosylformylglycinamidine synthase